MKTLESLVKAQNEYINLLVDEQRECIGLATVHGWKSERFEQGKKLRDKIAELRIAIGI